MSYKVVSLRVSRKSFRSRASAGKYARRRGYRPYRVARVKK